MSDGMTVQILSHEAGKEDNESWTRLQVVNPRGRFYVKFKGAKAEALTRDLVNTLSEGETIASKRLFIELFGEWTTFTRPNSSFKVRYFKAENYKVVNGPSLELARIRGQALEALQNAEVLRNAGAIAQAYKVVAAHLAELAQFPLDLSDAADMDDALIGQIAEGHEEYNPEKAAAAHYAREDALATERADREDAAMAGQSAEADLPEGDLDDIVISADPAEGIEDIPEAAPLEVADEETGVYSMLDDTQIAQDEEPAADDADEIPEEADEAEEAAQDEQDDAVQEQSAEVEDVPVRPAAPARRSFGFRR